MKIVVSKCQHAHAGLRMHAQVFACVQILEHASVRIDEHERVRMNGRMPTHEHKQIGLFDIFNLPLIKTHPKHVPTLPKASGFHPNPNI